MSEIQTLLLSFLLWKHPAKNVMFFQCSSSIFACPAPVHEVAYSNHSYNSHLHKCSSRQEGKTLDGYDIIIGGIFAFVVWYSAIIYEMIAMKAGEGE